MNHQFLTVMQQAFERRNYFESIKSSPMFTPVILANMPEILP